MGKSRRARGHGRQSRVAAKRARKTDDGPSLQQDAEDIEFELMDRVYAFTVDVLETDTSDPTGLRYRNKVFKTGDDVILNSKDDYTVDTWLGQISQIRTTKDKTKTLAKVQWYWSRNNVAAIIKSFDYTKCSPYERILSDQYDYVSPYAFQGVTHVHEYYEDDLNPPPIGPKTFFLRTTLLHRKKHLKPPLGHNTCYCQEQYNPYPVVTDETFMSPGEPPDKMHFCPSLHCRKCEAPFVMFAHFSEPESLEIVPDSTAQMTVYEALDLWTRKRSILTHLPPALLAIAQAPIVRCSGASRGWAIGNVADVVLARRFVYAAVEHNGPPERSAKFLELLAREMARQEDVFESWRARRRQAVVETADADVVMMDVDEGVGVERRRDYEQRGRQGSSTTTTWGGLWGCMDLKEDSADGGDGDGDSEEGTASMLTSTGKGKGAEWEPDEISAMEALCEDLGQFELLASPYARYWEERGRQFEAAAAAGLLDGPDFMCPQCRSAI